MKHAKVPMSGFAPEGEGGGNHLVLGPNAIDVQAFRQLVQATVQVVAKLHQVFNIIH